MALLLNDEYFEAVMVFVCRLLGLRHPRLEEFVVDFNLPGL